MRFRHALVAAVLLMPVARAHAQEPGEQATGRGAFMGMKNVTGEITAIDADTLTIKTEDGSTAKVVTTANTRMFKGQGLPFKLSDLKPGDGVMAAGNLDAPNKTMHAAILVATDAETVRKLKENLGKTYIAGKITAIDADNLKLTILRADQVSQVIGLDDSTSFKRGRGGRGGGQMFIMGGGPRPDGGAPPSVGAGMGGGESITLADIKVGDNVAGQGALKGGVFIPTQLTVSTPGERRQRPTDATAPAPKP